MKHELDTFHLLLLSCGHNLTLGNLVAKLIGRDAGANRLISWPLGRHVAHYHLNVLLGSIIIIITITIIISSSFVHSTATGPWDILNKSDKKTRLLNSHTRNARNRNSLGNCRGR